MLDRRLPERAAGQSAAASPRRLEAAWWRGQIVLKWMAVALVVMTLTGEQLKKAIEQQFAGPKRAGGRPAALGPSAGFNYTVDLKQPSGEHVVAMTLNGKPAASTGRYRVVLNNYLASGGDGLSGFTEGTDITDKGVIDLDALVDWVAKGQTPPKPDRISIVG